MTGLPRSDGLSRCSTAAKKASRSRCRIDAVLRISRSGRGGQQRHGPSSPTHPAWRPSPGPVRATNRPQGPGTACPQAGDRRCSRGASSAWNPLTRPRPRPPSAPHPTTLRVRTPGDIAAFVPLAMGFVPSGPSSW